MRKRRLRPTSPPLEERTDSNEESSSVKPYRSSSAKLCHYAIHTMSFLFFIVAVLTCFQILYTAEECDMTWSRRQFLLVERSVLHAKYRLYKFKDQRDPRYHRKSFHSNPSYCMNGTTVVLYIPGHGGSYEQSRSLGAHGTQLTRKYDGNSVESRVIQELKKLGTQGSIPSDIESFFFDVYAIDFAEEGGAFHAALLHRQSDFIARVVEDLTYKCKLESVIVVAHSMGGISTRLALLDHSASMIAVDTVITLGTPHARSVWTWETGCMEIYRRLGQQTLQQKTIVSISGGLRDEMIPPRYCYLAGDGAALNILSTNSMHVGSEEAKDVAPTFGMDHRSIVWCHNLLSEVRNIIFDVARSQNMNTDDRIAILQTKMNSTLARGTTEAEEYVSRVREQYGSLQERYGFIVGFALETGLLSNTELLVHLFACCGIMRYILHHDHFEMSQLFDFFIPFSLGMLQYSLQSMTDFPFLLALILTFTADAIFLIIRASIHILRIRLERGHRKGAAHAYSVLPFIAMFGISACFICWRWDWAGVKASCTIFSLSFVYIQSLRFTFCSVPPILALSRFHNQQVDYTVWLLLLLPFLTFGDVLMIQEGLVTWAVPFLTVPVIFRQAIVYRVFRQQKACTTRKERVSWPYESMRIVPIAVCSLKLLSIDSSSHSVLHPLSTLVLVTTSIDSLYYLTR